MRDAHRCAARVYRVAMAGSGKVSGAPSAAAVEGVTFELASFEWASPDRLELTGRFAGLERVPSPGPVLVVHGEDETHRLAPAIGSGAWPPADGADWRAGFAWNEAPAPFDAVELELATGVAVELPAPGAEPARSSPLVAMARREPGRDDGGELVAVVPGVAPAPPTEALHAALDVVRQTAEQVVATEHDTVERLASELRAAQGEIDALRARVGVLEPLAKSADELRGERDVALGHADELRSALADAERAADEHRRECERLRRRLDAIRRAVDDGA